MSDAPFEGVFRRQIDLRAWDESTVVAWLEDESHHFGITLVHDGIRALDVRMAAPRHPWSTCAAAGIPLRAFVGMPLFARCGQLGSLIEMTLQCTHLFDLLGLAVAHAHAGRKHRRYHGTVRPLADVRVGAPAGWQRAALERDGVEVAAWELDGDRIRDPEALGGRSILEGFRDWTQGLPLEQAEIALVLRRVAFVSKGRRISIEHALVAADMGQGPVCHTFQPEHSIRAVRVDGSRRRFDDCPEAMLALAGTMP